MPKLIAKNAIGGALFLAIGVLLAQVPERGWSPSGRSGRMGTGPRGGMAAREVLPTWEINPQFGSDVFTFVRIQFDSNGPFGWHDRWDNDYPDGDRNLSLRLQQLTSLVVNPQCEVLRLTDSRLQDYPFIYLAGVQYMSLSPVEHVAFRQYLVNGGFFMMDDLWALDSLDNVLHQMRAVLPDIEPEELSLDHELFHLVYDLQELPQVTDYQTWSSGAQFEYAHAGIRGDSAPHFIAFFDQQRRMLGVICHNNDIGDGWEREGHHSEYFNRYSVKHSYPFGINIVTYAMTH